MSHSFIDPKNDYYNYNDDSDTIQKKIDPVAQAKWLSTPQVHGGWGLFNQPDQNLVQNQKQQSSNNQDKGIKNGYRDQLENAQSYVDNIKKSLEKGDLTDDQRKMNEKYLKMGEKHLKKVQEDFDKTEALILKLKEIDNELFDEANTIKDSEGNEVDVYIKVRDISGDDAVYGTTNLNAAKDNPNVYTSSYGDNTVSVKSTNDVRILAHELGHVIYQVPNLEAYMKYYDSVYNSGYYKEKSRGHAPGDKSGEMVEAVMKKFNRKYKEYRKANKK